MTEARIFQDDLILRYSGSGLQNGFFHNRSRNFHCHGVALRGVILNIWLFIGIFLWFPQRTGRLEKNAVSWSSDAVYAILNVHLNDGHLLTHHGPELSGGEARGGRRLPQSLTVPRTFTIDHIVETPRNDTGSWMQRLQQR